jgi:hypothetical protein
MKIILTPQPVSCKNCFYLLQASYAAQHVGRCPACGEMACFTCGCVEHIPCHSVSSTRDGLRSTTSGCSWAEPGLCTFCQSEAAYVLYMLVTGREPSDQSYLRTYVPGQTHHLAA